MGRQKRNIYHKSYNLSQKLRKLVHLNFANRDFLLYIAYKSPLQYTLDKLFGTFDGPCNECNRMELHRGAFKRFDQPEASFNEHWTNDLRHNVFWLSKSQEKNKEN